jgi:hypothetical protein
MAALKPMASVQNGTNQTHIPLRFQTFGQFCPYKMGGVIFIRFADSIAGTLVSIEAIAGATGCESQKFSALSPPIRR